MGILTIRLRIWVWSELWIHDTWVRRPWNTAGWTRHRLSNERWNMFSWHQHWNLSSILRYLERGVSEFWIETHLRINISGRIPATRTTTAGRQHRRRGSKKPLENGHNKKHGDQDGSGNKPERDCIYGLIKMSPMIISLVLCVQWWSFGWWQETPLMNVISTHQTLRHTVVLDKDLVFVERLKTVSFEWHYESMLGFEGWCAASR